MKTIDVLHIVDDDSTYQMLAKAIIKSTQLVDNFKVFNNGAEAIDYLKLIKDNPDELPQVILLDLFMPIMNGWNFLDEFINIKPYLKRKITIYLVSSSIDPEDIKKAQEISAVSDFIIKPLTKDKFINIVNSIA